MTIVSFRHSLGCAAAGIGVLRFLVGSVCCRGRPPRGGLPCFRASGKSSPQVVRAAFSDTRRKTMGRKLYVGNLPYSAAEQDLQELFERVGPVESVTVMRDMATGRA